MHSNKLNAALAEASRVDYELNIKAVTNIPDISKRLSDALLDAKEWALEESIITSGYTLLTKLDTTYDLLNDTAALIEHLPIRTQEAYTNYVHKVERTLYKAEVVGAATNQLEITKKLIKFCTVQYMISMFINRLKHVDCATDPNEHDMNRLKDAVDQAKEFSFDMGDIIDEGDFLYKRLESELIMSRTMSAIPIVKLPIENQTDGYWEDCDVGKIEETDEYPLPPADNNGEYNWIPSESFTLLKNAIETLRESLVGADTVSANSIVIAAAKEKLMRSEKQLKVLECKDATDKALALEVVAKLVKKLKKGKKGKKKLN